MAIATAPDPTQRYYVTHEGKIRGPFEFRVIEALVLAEQFPADVSVSSFGGPVSSLGLEKWVPLNSISKEAPLVWPPEITPPTWKSPGVFPWMVGAPTIALILMAAAIRFNPPDFIRNWNNPPPVSKAASSITPPATNSKPKGSTATTLIKAYNGRNYRVSNDTALRLIAKRAQTDAESASIDKDKKELDELNLEINTLKSSIDKSSAFSVEYLNKKVNTYDVNNSLLKSRIESFNSTVTALNAEIASVGTAED
ncbi:MAG: hypothetical protein ACAI35_13160 [Candidatus Methylacidiphilales bacterium]|nr:hypothetical protein [Candidatus Methylacidiphilales bacterium]